MKIYIQIVIGSHPVVIKEANFRMNIILQVANQIDQINWVLDKIIELQKQITINPTLTLAFQLYEPTHFLIILATKAFLLLAYALK